MTQLLDKVGLWFLYSALPNPFKFQAHMLKRATKGISGQMKTRNVEFQRKPGFRDLKHCL